MRYICSSILVLILIIGVFNKSVGQALNGKIVEGIDEEMGVPNAMVAVRNHTTAYSDEDFGTFSISLPGVRPGKKINLNVKKTGFTVINRESLKPYLPADQSEEIIIHLAPAGKRDELALEFYRIKITQNIDESYIEAVKQATAEVNTDRLAELTFERNRAIDHAESMAARFASFDPESSSEELTQAMQLYQEGNVADAIKSLDVNKASERLLNRKRALITLQKNIDKELEKFQFFADMAITKGQFEKADSMYQAILEVDEENIKNLLFYADFLVKQNKQRYAEPYLQKALSLQPDSIHQASIYQLLGGIYAKSAKYEKADSYYQQSLSLRRALLKQENELSILGLAKILNSLGLLQLARQQPTKAESTFKEALTLFNETSLDSASFSLTLANLTNNMGMVQKGIGKYHEALTQFERASSLYQNALDKSATPDPALQAGLTASQANITNIQLMQFRDSDVEESLAQSETILRGLVEQNQAQYTPSLAALTFNRGVFEGEKGEWEEAYKLFTEAEQIYQKLFEDDASIYWSQLAKAKREKAHMLQKQKAFDKAIVTYEEATSLFENYLPDGINEFQIDAGITHFQYANALANFKEYEKALTHYQEARDFIFTRYLERPLLYTPYLARIADSKGYILRQQGKYQEALSTYGDAKNMYWLSIKALLENALAARVVPFIESTEFVSNLTDDSDADGVPYYFIQNPYPLTTISLSEILYWWSPNATNKAWKRWLDPDFILKDPTFKLYIHQANSDLFEQHEPKPPFQALLLKDTALAATNPLKALFANLSKEYLSIFIKKGNTYGELGQFDEATGTYQSIEDKFSDIQKLIDEIAKSAYHLEPEEEAIISLKEVDFPDTHNAHLHHNMANLGRSWTPISQNKEKVLVPRIPDLVELPSYVAQEPEVENPFIPPQLHPEFLPVRLVVPPPKAVYSQIVEVETNASGLFTDQNFDQALGIYKRYQAEDSLFYQSLIASSMFAKANWQYYYQKYDGAISSFSKAVNYFLAHREEDPAFYDPRIANTYLLQGNSFLIKKEFENASNILREANKWYQKLAKEQPERFHQLYAIGLNNQAVADLFGILNPKFQWDNLEEAIYAVDWKGLERIRGKDSLINTFQQAVTTFQFREQEESKQYKLEGLHSLENLGTTQRWGNRLEASYATYQNVVNMYRELTKEDEEQFATQLLTTQYDMCFLLKAWLTETADQVILEKGKQLLGELEQDKKTYAKGAQKLSFMGSSLEQLTNWFNTPALIGLINDDKGWDELQAGDEEKALSYFDRAVKEYERVSDSKLGIRAGYHKAFALTHFSQLTQDKVQAYEAQKKAIPYLEAFAQDLPAPSWEADFRIGAAYHNLGILALYTARYKEAENSCRKAIDLAFHLSEEDYGLQISSSVSPVENWISPELALALLLQGKWEEAKSLYTALADKDIPEIWAQQDWTKNHTTFKEVFLADIKNLEEKGITHPDMRKAKNLLEE